jgi:uncharacterized protein YdeI (YjbR/CyaY-like superfamily)
LSARFFSTPAAFPVWLQAHHQTEKELLVGFHKKESPAQETALRAKRRAGAFFDAQAPWYQRAALHWVVSAKREETRERRLEQLIAHSAAGRTVPPLTRPGSEQSPVLGR